MHSDALYRLRDLVLRTRVLTIGVLVDGKPVVGLLPYVYDAESNAVLIHASALARHSRGLIPGAPFSLIIHKPDSEDDDPLQIQRAMFDGEVEVISPDTPAYDRGRRAFIERFPQTEMTFSLSDFTLFALHLRTGRYVEGFATATLVTPDDLRALAA